MQIRTPVGIAAASGVSEAELADVSKVAMNAYAKDLEEQLGDLQFNHFKALMVAGEAIAMKDLFKNPAKVADLSICALDSILNTPGGLDTFVEIFYPVMTLINNGGQMPAEAPQAPQWQQSQATQPQGPIADAGPRQFGWDGAAPSQARANFPAMPQQAAMGGGTTLQQIAPHDRWRALDQGLR
jgi:hypothetical protein